MIELQQPIFDRHTLPGTSFTLTQTEDRASAQITHIRERGAPSRSLYRATPEDARQEIAAYEERQAVNRFLTARGVKPLHDSSAIYADVASAVVTKGVWITDGPSYNTSTTEAILATSPTLAGSGTGAGPDAMGGFWYPGRAVRMWWTGIISSAAATPGNLTINHRLNTIAGATLGAGPVSALATSMATIAWSAESRIVCRSISTSAGGATGALECYVKYHSILSATQLTAAIDMQNRAAPAFDSTINNIVVVTGLYSFSSASNITITKLFIVEVLN